jgi:hypothetical protein
MQAHRLADSPQDSLTKFVQEEDITAVASEIYAQGSKQGKG